MRWIKCSCNCTMAFTGNSCRQKQLVSMWQFHNKKKAPNQKWDLHQSIAHYSDQRIGLSCPNRGRARSKRRSLGRCCGLLDRARTRAVSALAGLIRTPQPPREHRPSSRTRAAAAADLPCVPPAARADLASCKARRSQLVPI